MLPPTVDDVGRVVAAFGLGASSVERLDAGHINDSFVVDTDVPAVGRIVVQRINTDVFVDPAAVTGNTERVVAHLATTAGAGVRVPDLVRTPAGAGHVVASTGWWRATRYEEGVISYRRPPGVEMVREAAAAFGAYDRSLADLPPPPLAQTIARFHDLAHRARALDHAVRGDPQGRLGACRRELDRAGRVVAAVLDARRAIGWERLPRRPVHNDAKLENVLFDAATGRVRCVVDLDTTMPGRLPDDAGELVRSTVSGRSEDDDGEVVLDLDRFAAVVDGFLAGVGPACTPAERAALAVAGPGQAAENGVRFLTDHLLGDRYFRVHQPGHNLARARAQLRLAEALLDRLADLRRLVARG